MMEYWQVWLIGALTLGIGCWIQSAIGFGLAVVAAPVLVWIRPDWVPVILTLTALVLSGLNAWHQRHYLNSTAMLVPMATRLPGLVLGVWFLAIMDVRTLQILVSLTVLAAVALSVSRLHFEETRVNLGIAGLVSGVTGTTTAIGGPPMAVVMQHGRPEQVRANLSLYFTYSCFTSLIGYWYIGLLDRELLLTSLSFAPVMLIGLFAGIRMRRHINQAQFRQALLGLCFMAGVAALIGALLNP